MSQRITEPALTFSDILGDFSVIDNLVFLPKQEGLSSMTGLKEAELKMRMLCEVVLGGKSVITHGSVSDREYLLYYDDNGAFDAKRVYKSKLEQLSFFSYLGLNLVSFLGREIEMISEHIDLLKVTSKRREKFGAHPKVAAVFECNSSKSINFSLNTIYNAFPTVEVIILIDDGFYKIDKKEGSMVLC
jgi:hypothetical protein